MTTLKEAIRNRKQPPVSTVEAILLQQVYRQIEDLVKAEYEKQQGNFIGVTNEEIASFKALNAKLRDSLIQTVGKSEGLAVKIVSSEGNNKLEEIRELTRVSAEILSGLVARVEDKQQEVFSNIDKHKGPKGDTGPKGKDGKRGDDGKSVTKEEILEELRPEIRRLETEIKKGLRDIKVKKGGGGGGMGNTNDKAFSGDGVTVAFTLDYKVASGGKAALVIINGQVQERSTHYNISGNVVTFTTAPEDGAYIWVQYVRA